MLSPTIEQVFFAANFLMIGINAIFYGLLKVSQRENWRLIATIPQALSWDEET